MGGDTYPSREEIDRLLANASDEYDNAEPDPTEHYFDTMTDRFFDTSQYSGYVDGKPIPEVPGLPVDKLKIPTDITSKGTVLPEFHTNVLTYPRPEKDPYTRPNALRFHYEPLDQEPSIEEITRKKKTNLTKGVKYKKPMKEHRTRRSTRRKNKGQTHVKPSLVENLEVAIPLSEEHPRTEESNTTTSTDSKSNAPSRKSTRKTR